MQNWVIGNWKLNGDQAFVRNYVASFLPSLQRSEQFGGVSIGLCPPACYIASLVSEVEDKAKGLSVKKPVIGAQNVSAEASGAFTGEISAAMIRDCGASLALAGHSERRQLFGESDEVVAAKVRSIVKAGITSVLCVGETLEERSAEQTLQVVERQLAAVFKAQSFDDWHNLLIAYEPVWAIGTGLTATPEQAQSVHAFIRDYTAKAQQGSGTAVMVPLLYGGSVKADNAAELMAQQDVDGLLVGGASLQPEVFASIVAHTASCI